MILFDALFLLSVILAVLGAVFGIGAALADHFTKRD